MDAGIVTNSFVRGRVHGTIEIVTTGSLITAETIVAQMTSGEVKGSLDYGLSARVAIYVGMYALKATRVWQSSYIATR